MRVEWDERKRLANLRKHGIDFADAASVFDDPAVLTLEDLDAEDECRFVSLGRGCAGRMLIVVWAGRAEDLVRMISARHASPGECQPYED